ncbi:MAG: MBL fold metallo-hydrolase [Candidatus Cryptobacteroides sp.]|jgi:phosphoribosyl 1,2-cyclic phosphodiesterase
MLKFLSLSSGSSGNCYFLTDGVSGLLIDAGVSPRRVRKELGAYGLGFNDFQAILVTHDHLDHIRYLGAFCKRFQKPVYATPLLHEAMLRHTFTRDFITPCRRVFSEGANHLSDGIELRYFVVPHDATQTVGFAIDWKGHRFVLMTDVGCMTQEAFSYAAAADTVVIESNYDMGMLISGNYPQELKMRICRGRGHLGNEECAEAILKFWHPGLRNIFLCHLSDNNNTPSLAFESAAAALSALSSEDGRSAREITALHTLPRGRASLFFEL